MSQAELVRASAGTGKTYRLVEAYVRALLQHKCSPSQVVAITFTRKAARELRARIRKRLSGVVSADVLSELSRAPINNFHGLALQLLAQVPHAVGSLEGFTVLGEDGDDDRLFVEASREAWLGDASVVNADVAAVAKYFQVDSELAPALWSVIARAREDGRAVVGAELVAHPTSDPAARLAPRLLDLRARLGRSVGELSELTRAKVEAALALIPPYVEGDFIAYAEAWTRAAKQLDRKGKLGKLIVPEELELMRAGALDLARAHQVCRDLASPFARLIDAAWKRYGELKHERRMLDFTDLVERVCALIEGDADYHQRLRERFRYVLVDEAQDTNRLQRHFVHLLVGLSGPAATQREPAGFFVVGDRKQAIYTFRGADPESFDAFNADVRAMGGSEATLVTSWRATPSLCATVNHLGDALFGRDYEAMAAAQARCQCHADAITEGARWVVTPDGASSSSRLLAEADSLATWVAERLRLGESVDNFVLLLSALSNAPLYVAALAARGIASVIGGGGALYAQAEVVDVAALLRWSVDPEDRLAAAVALRSPLLGVSDSGLLRLLARGAADGLAQLYAGRLSPDALGEADSNALRLVLSCMPRLWRAAKVMSAADLLHYAVDVLDLEALFLALPGGQRKAASIRHLEAVADDYQRRGIADARHFADELQRRIARGSREPLSGGGGHGAVTIGSVHQAKGLEFPIVLLADLGHGRPNDNRPLGYSQRQGIVLRPRIAGKLSETLESQEVIADGRAALDAELRRLLYVAVTRAERALVFFAPARTTTRESFLQLLQAWRDQAAAAGVLTIEQAVQEADASVAVVVEPPVTAETVTLLATDVTASTAAAPGSTVSLAVTELETFLQCHRRGALRHQLLLDEPRFGAFGVSKTTPAALEPVIAGRLVHALLANADDSVSDHDYPRWVDERLASLGYDAKDPALRDVTTHALCFMRSPLWTKLARLTRNERRHELPFVHRVPVQPFVVAIRGQMDLLYLNDGEPVVLDFKYARESEPAVAGYRLQLEIYALAAAELCQSKETVRTQLAFLKTSEVREHLVTPPMRAQLTERIAAFARELGVVQQQRREWPGQPRARCEQLGCGFIGHCHAAQRGEGNVLNADHLPEGVRT